MTVGCLFVLASLQARARGGERRGSVFNPVDRVLRGSTDESVRRVA